MMNIYDIKDKANEILADQSHLFKVMIFMGIFNAVVNVFGDVFTGMIGTIITIVLLILMIPFSHGYIVSSLKAVCNRDRDIDVQQDGLVGFYRFKELFSTYFMYQFLLLMIIIVVCLIFLVIGLFILSQAQIDALKQFMVICGEYATGNSLALSKITVTMTSTIAKLVPILFLLMIVLLVILFVYSLTFGLTPYILEKYGLKGFAAMNESKRLMKGNKTTLFKLELSFLGWMILAMFIVGLLTSVLESIFGLSVISSLLANIISVFVTVYFYDMKLKICEAVFYEELDYEDKKIIDVEENIDID